VTEAQPTLTVEEQARGEDGATTAAAADRATPSFAHASEAEMARILDFYAVRWAYEPVTFPILWNLEGDVVESFSPDFYLPDLDLFLEMTTLKQRLVRKKNRKLRRLRELYPDIRIKLFYARDFRAMLLKYGRFALVDSLSGTLGQMAPDRSEPRIALATGTAAALVDLTEPLGSIEPLLATELEPPPITPIEQVVPSEPPSQPIAASRASAGTAASRARRRRRRAAAKRARTSQTPAVPASGQSTVQPSIAVGPGQAASARRADGAIR
jgi:hypothetical protein